MSVTNLTFAGVGGQGSILAGTILGQAAVAYADGYATQTQAYSSELRGGFAATWLIFSDKPVGYPRVVKTDILVAQAQDSIQRFASTLNPDGVLLVDTDMVTDIPHLKATRFGIAATSIARNRFGAPIVANIVMLGALTRVAPVVNRTALEKAIAETVPSSKVDLNLRAFAAGFDEAASLN